VLYKKELDEEPKVLKLDGCDEDCKFVKFLKIVKPLIPKDWKKECISDEI